tara:strand:- start:146 stop:454 length:309 start_codon:yes stop_codon:yes gene_type:complete
MSEVKQYDSVLVGYAEEPRRNDAGEVISWSVRFKGSELDEMRSKYATSVNDQGQGDNVYVTMFLSMNNKPCCRVFDPESAAAKERRAAKQAAKEAQSSDLPF